MTWNTGRPGAPHDVEQRAGLWPPLTAEELDERAALLSQDLRRELVERLARLGSQHCTGARGLEHGRAGDKAGPPVEAAAHAAGRRRTCL